MPWFRIKISSFGIGHDAGPPPSIRLAWLRVSWLPADVAAAIDKLERAFRAAKEELRK